MSFLSYVTLICILMSVVGLYLLMSSLAPRGRRPGQRSRPSRRIGRVWRGIGRVWRGIGRALRRFGRVRRGRPVTDGRDRAAPERLIQGRVHVPPHRHGDSADRQRREEPAPVGARRGGGGRLLDDPPPGPDGVSAAAYREAPVSPPPPAPSGTAPQFTPSGSARAAAPGAVVEFAVHPEDAVAPRFVPGSRAARMPWLLPAESASPSGVAADQGVLGSLEIRAASVVGPGHRCEEPVKPRQDAYRVARDRTGDHLLVAVADGMGDSARAELGASVAVATAVALLRRHLDGNRPLTELRGARLFGDVSNALVQAARDRQLDPDDVRTTLAVAVLPTHCQPDRPARAWAAQIADTHVWRRRGGDGWDCLTGTAKSSFDGSTLNAFLPHVPHVARGMTFELDWGDTVAVLSDGVADVFSDVAGAEGWFAQRWRDPPPLASFLLDVDFEAKTMQDDRTAVVVWTGRGDAAGRARRR